MSIDIHPRNQDIEQLFTDTISSHVGHRSSDIIKLCIDQIEVQTGRLVGSVAYIEIIEDGTLTWWVLEWEEIILGVFLRWRENARIITFFAASIPKAWNDLRLRHYIYMIYKVYVHVRVHHDRFYQVIQYTDAICFSDIFDLSIPFKGFSGPLPFSKPNPSRWKCISVLPVVWRSCVSLCLRCMAVSCSPSGWRSCQILSLASPCAGRQQKLQLRRWIHKWRVRNWTNIRPNVWLPDERDPAMLMICQAEKWKGYGSAEGGV